MRMTRQKTSRCASIAFASACLALAAACGGNPPPASSTTVEPAAAAFVASFYEWFAKPKTAGGGDLDWERVLQERPRSLDAPLLAALREDRAAAARNPGELVGLEFVPFTANQDPCEEYETGDATIVADRVRVPVFSVCNGRRLDAPSVSAEVAKREGEWVFTNVIFGDGDDLLAMLKRQSEERAKPMTKSLPTA